jgi:DNA uptake protein ComE-like DNA-binding protein
VEEAEARMQADRERQEQAMEDAYRRLEEIEARAKKAEERAARAERLAELKAEEADRERRLREVLERVSAAEQRAVEAERKAREAEARAASKLPPSRESGVEEPEAKQEGEGGGILGRTVGAILGVGAGREEGAEEETAPAPEETPVQAQQVEEIPANDRVNLNQATFEDLRDIGFSVTQATRVITYRERQKGFDSLDDLGEVPGMPDDFLAEIKPKLSL